MANTPRPSFPSYHSEPNLRRLGVGGGGGGGDRPLRAQLVIALVVVLVLIGVPMYLLRRPSGDENATSAGRGDGGSAVGKRFIRTELDAGPRRRAKVRFGPVQRVKCSSGPTARGNEGTLCDQLRPIEEALVKSIKQNVDCAPSTGKEGTINFVATVDFATKSLKVFPGASGDWKGPQARRTAQCVSRSFPPLEWDGVSHKYRYYMIAIMTTYPAPDVGGLPSFE